MDFSTKEIGSTARKDSFRARYGNRYYPVDPGYDKRVYENTCGNWVIIVSALLAFWFFNGLHWWGVLRFGICESELLTIYSLAIFGFTIFFGIILLFSGKYANAKKRKFEFLKERVAELRNEELDRKERAKQEAAYQEKLAEQEAKKKAILAQQNATPAPNTMGGVPTSIQGATSPEDVRIIQTNQ